MAQTQPQFRFLSLAVLVPMASVVGCQKPTANPEPAVAPPPISTQVGTESGNCSNANKDWATLNDSLTQYQNLRGRINSVPSSGPIKGNLNHEQAKSFKDLAGLKAELAKLLSEQVVTLGAVQPASLDCKYPGLGHLFSTYYLPGLKEESEVLTKGDLTKPEWGKKAADADGKLSQFVLGCESAKIPIPQLGYAW